MYTRTTKTNAPLDVQNHEVEEKRKPQGAFLVPLHLQRKTLTFPNLCLVRESQSETLRAIDIHRVIKKRSYFTVLAMTTRDVDERHFGGRPLSRNRRLLSTSTCSGQSKTRRVTLPNASNRVRGCISCAFLATPLGRRHMLLHSCWSTSVDVPGQGGRLHKQTNEQHLSSGNTTIARSQTAVGENRFHAGRRSEPILSRMGNLPKTPIK